MFLLFFSLLSCYVIELGDKLIYCIHKDSDSMLAGLGSNVKLLLAAETDSNL